jgi:putative aminopeptidase FrvX
MLEHLKALCALDGVSGKRDRDISQSVALKYADEVKTIRWGMLFP